MCEKHLKISEGGETDSFDFDGIFDIFAVSPPQATSGKRLKYLNVLEFLTALVLLADFGESSNDDLQHNAELIEHKINLLLILFDLRQQSRLNIAEVIIMLRTCLQALSKVFPSVGFFRNQTVQNEIKETMVNVFKDRLEQGVAEMYGLNDPSKPTVSQVEKQEGSSFLGFI